MELSPRSKLIAQLSVVDRAIEKLANEEDVMRSKSAQEPRSSPSKPSRSVLAQAATSLLASSSSSALPVTAHSVDVDHSYRISTRGIQPVLCDFCNKEVDARNLDKHKALECTNRLVTCPHIECGQSLHAQALPRHLRYECPATLSRTQLVHRGQARQAAAQAEEVLRQTTLVALSHADKEAVPPRRSPSPSPPSSPTPLVLCAACTQPLRASALPHHLAETCPCRGLPCPNYGAGCGERSLPLAQLHTHLVHHCLAERHRQEMLAHSRARLEPVQCATCGEKVAVKDWRRHEAELCANRLVPCKHQALGCRVLVPRLERAVHECIEEGYARHGVYLNGMGARLCVQETDVLGAWTVEAWLFRPPAREAFKSHLLNVLHLLPAYLLAVAAEVAIQRRVLHLVAGLKEDVSQSREEQLAFAKLSKAERGLWQKDKLDQRMHRVNELTAAIPTYSEAVLSYLQAFQTLAICLEGAGGCLQEHVQGLSLSKPKGGGGHVDGHDNDHKDDEDEAEAFSLQTEYPGDLGVGPSPPSPPSRATSARYTDPQNLDPRGQEEGRRTRGRVPSREDDGGVDSARLPSQASETDVSHPSSAVPSAASSFSLPSETAALPAQGLLQLFTCSPSAVSQYLAQCFHTESVRSRTSFSSSASPPVSPRAGLGEEGGEEASSLEADILLGLQLPGERPGEGGQGRDSGSQGRPSPWTAFLYAWAVHPTAALRTHRLAPQAWRGLVQALAQAVKTDFDDLLLGRIQAGLLTPEAGQTGTGTGTAAAVLARRKPAPPAVRLDHLLSQGVGEEGGSPRDAGEGAGGGGGGGGDEDPRDKAARKREKERQRRELKKLRTQEAEALESQTLESQTQTLESQIQTQKGQTQTQKGQTQNLASGPPKEAKLLVRTTELLRSGCGAELWLESHSSNALGSRSRVCLAMYSGLSLLFPSESQPSPRGGPGRGAERHYSLLLPLKELSRLSALQGQAGVVQAVPDGQPVTEWLGSQSAHFHAKIPRGRWTHVAVVASRQKTVLCVDGHPAATLKDCSFPLPMQAVGGSPHSCLTFRGVIMDVRVWDHARGGQQIERSMHRLVTLSPKGAANMKLSTPALSATSEVSALLGEDGGGREGASAGRGAGPTQGAASLAAPPSPSPSSSSPPQPRPPSTLPPRASTTSRANQRSRGKTRWGGQRVLPEDDGLIAWWTFEDGPGSRHVTDVTRHRFKTPLSTELSYEVQYSVCPRERYPLPVSLLHDVAPALRALVPSDILGELGLELPGRKTEKTAARDWVQRLQAVHRLCAHWQWIQLETVRCVGGEASRPPPPSHAGPRPSHLPSYLWEEAGRGLGEESPSLPLPSFREENLCPFEIHRLRLAKRGRHLDDPLPCPLGCGLTLTRRRKRMHVRVECPRRFVRCRYAFCASLFPAQEQERHEREDCAAVTGRERWLERAKRQKEEVFCYRCHEAVALREMRRHQLETCEQRLVYCPYPDCAWGACPRTRETETSPTRQQGGEDEAKKGEEAKKAGEENNSGAEDTYEATVEPQLPAHRLAHHLRYDCTSSKRKTLWMLVQRARERQPYARPWGVSVELVAGLPPPETD